MAGHRSVRRVGSFVVMLTLGLASGVSAIAGGLHHGHVVKYRVVQGYILQPQVSTANVVVHQTAPASAQGSGANLPSLRLAPSAQNESVGLSLAPPAAQTPTTNSTVTLQLAPSQPEPARTVTLQLAPAPAPVQTQTLQLSAMPVQTMQLAPVQTLQVAPQTVTSQTLTPVQFLLPKHHHFFGY